MSGTKTVKKTKARKKRTVYPKFPKEIFCSSFVDDNRKRIFIENDIELRPTIASAISRDLNHFNGLTWEQFFMKTIINARNVDDDILFKDIVETDDIFLWTSFVQESGYMFDAMAEMALKINLTGKRIFILREQGDTFMHAYFDKKLFNKAAKLNAFYFEPEQRNYDNRNFVLYDPKKNDD